MSHKGVFENSDDDFESESGEDFSASEDEWKPGKDDHVSDEDEDEVVNDASGSSDDVSDEDEPSGSRKRNSKKSKTKASKKNAKAPKLNAAAKGRQTSTLRSKLFRRYNPPPKTVNRSPVPSKVADILSNSQYKERKPKMSAADKKAAVFSESDSSDDDGLVNPSQLDFNSEFFNLKATVNRDNQTEQSAPVFDCNAGMNLSDSSGNENEEFDEVNDDKDTDKPKKSSIINKINSKSSNEMHDFSSLQNFAKNLESAKAQLEKLKNKEANASTSKSAADESDITKLLSLGEGATTSSTPGRKRKHKDGQHSDDSEWENVSDNGDGNEIKDIQITVGGTVMRGMTRDQKKAIDLEACLKRRLNRDIKQKQVWLHKSAVLCWLAHGNYINSVLNNITLMKMCLKLLPSKNAYPKGDTDVKYYHMITDWFHNLFQLTSDKLYCPLKRLPPKIVSLGLQIQSKKIISKCDFVLLFVALLRSLGIQCRLVINFAVPPQQPPQKDLFHISNKPKESEDTKSKDKQSSPTPPGYITLGESLAKKIKVCSKKAKQASFKEKLSSSSSRESDKSPPPKATRSTRAKSSKPTDHSYAGPSKMKSSESKSIKSSKSKNSSTGTDHSYTDKPFEKVKVKLSRMSESFVAKETAAPATKSSSSSQKSTHKHTSQSPSTSKSKKQKDSQEENKHSSKHEQHTNSNDKSTKVKEIGNAASSQESPTKSSSTQSVKVTHSNGTVTKHKLVERTNSIEVSKNRPKDTNKESVKASISNEKAFSPRKTRSKASKIADVAATTKAKTKLKLPQLDGAHDDDQPTKKRAKAKASAKSRAVINVKDSGSDDSDFAPTPQKRVRAKITPQKPVNKALVKAKQHDRRVFSTDDENDADVNTVKMNFWVEAYAEKEKKWIVIDPVKRKVDCVDHVRKHASKPIIYVFAWNNDNTIRDVTPRYCSQFHTATRRLRAEQLWIDDALEQFVEQRNPRTIIEDVEFSKLHMDTPMPTSINEFKNHPLYALERHLLKYEGIYPPKALILGYVRNEPVYARDCVHTLHSRELWVKQARVVRVGEKPYKLVRARPRWNRVLQQIETPTEPLEIFGIWQTDPYQPPVAENGLVPRNAYGNVELFKAEMLPIGTRHIQLPNLNRVCKKMGVDCAQAVIGFEYTGGYSHPTFDGFVVCEEFAEDVILQWEVEQEEQIRKETEKREARVFGNWKKLIKGLFIRERLKRKFNFGAEPSPDQGHGGKRKKE